MENGKEQSRVRKVNLRKRHLEDNSDETMLGVVSHSVINPAYETLNAFNGLTSLSLSLSHLLTLRIC